jgi:hypothetical protein
MSLLTANPVGDARHFRCAPEWGVHHRRCTTDERLLEHTEQMDDPRHTGPHRAEPQAVHRC